MIRAALVAAFLVMVSGCSVGSPSSLMMGLEADAPAPRPPQPVQVAASEEPSLAGRMWSKVKSGLGVEDSQPTGKPSAVRFDAASAERAVNAYRVQKGLPPLKLNQRLSAAAQEHSADLAKNDRISHYGSDGSDAWARVRKAGYSPRLTAENVGTGQLSLDEVMAGWKKSEGHNRNLLLREAKEMGIAMVYRGDTQFKTFWTLVLAAP